MDRRRQLRRLRAWYRHGGLGYAVWRLWLSLDDRRGKAAARVRYPRSLAEIGAKHGFTVVSVPNVNGASAQRALRDLEVDIAVSIGNRVIQPSTFAIPSMGMINLHHGAIPEYRGGPPAFWELHDGVSTMGISVHRIDEALDHGELLGRGEVPIELGDTPRTLMEKARAVDYRLLHEVLIQLAEGTSRPIEVGLDGSVVRTLPSRAELRAAQARVGEAIQPDDFRSAALLPIIDDG